VLRLAFTLVPSKRPRHAAAKRLVPVRRPPAPCVCAAARTSACAVAAWAIRRPCSVVVVARRVRGWWGEKRARILLHLAAVSLSLSRTGISSTRFLRQKEVELARVQSMLAQTVADGKRHTELYEQSQAQIHELTSELEDLKGKAPARGRETNRTDRWSKSPSRRASVAQVDANWALLKTSTESRFFKPNLYHSRSLMAGFSFCMRASSSDTLRMSLSKLCSCIWLSWSAVGRSHVWPIIKAWPCWSRGSTCRRSCRRRRALACLPASIWRGFLDDESLDDILL
jgi:hypothetical protein